MSIFAVLVGDRPQPAGYVKAVDEWDEYAWSKAQALAILQTAHMGVDCTYECLTLVDPEGKYFTPPPVFWVSPDPIPDEPLGDGCNETHLSDASA